MYGEVFAQRTIFFQGVIIFYLHILYISKRMSQRNIYHDSKWVIINQLLYQLKWLVSCSRRVGENVLFKQQTLWDYMTWVLFVSCVFLFFWGITGNVHKFDYASLRYLLDVTNWWAIWCRSSCGCTGMLLDVCVGGVPA